MMLIKLETFPWKRDLEEDVSFPTYSHTYRVQRVHTREGVRGRHSLPTFLPCLLVSLSRSHAPLFQVLIPSLILPSLWCDTRCVKQREIGINGGRGRPGSSNFYKAKQSRFFFSKSVKNSVKRGVRVLSARSAQASHARRVTCPVTCEAGKKTYF